MKKSLMENFIFCAVIFRDNLMQSEQINHIAAHAKEKKRGKELGSIEQSLFGEIMSTETEVMFKY